MISEDDDFRVRTFDRYCASSRGDPFGHAQWTCARLPPDTMKPGDVFLMKRHLSHEDSIGNLPDL